MPFDPYFDKNALVLPLETATTFNDKSNRPKVITNNGVTISTDHSQWGAGAAYFGGAGYLSASYSDDFSFLSRDWEITVYIYPTSSAATNKTLIDFRGGTGFVLFLNSANKLQFYDGALSSQSANAVLVNTFSLIGLHKIGNTSYWSIGGVMNGAAASSKSTYPNATYLLVGASSDPSARYSGYMNDLRISNGVCRNSSDFTPYPALWRRATKSGIARRQDTLVGADRVALYDHTSQQFAATATPDSSGNWSAEIDTGSQYDIVYSAAGYAPKIHGPYTF